MQSILAVDYLQGNFIPKDQLWEGFLRTTNALITSVDIEEDGALSVSKKSTTVGTYGGCSLDLPVEALLSQDKPLRSFLYCYKKYQKVKAKNYVMGKDLSKALVYTKKDVDMRYLPKNFCAYILLPDNITKKKFYGAFVCTEWVKDTWFLTLSYICKDKNPLNNEQMIMAGHFSVPYKEGVMFNDVLKDIDHKDKKAFDTDYEDNLYTRTLIQSVIYIANTDTTFVEEVNEFSQKKSKAEGQRRSYTSLPFIRVGFNFHFPRTFTVDSTVVSGHFRWQPYGPQRSLVKHIYIDPHVRSYNNE